jgi:hypothetical protein
VEEAELPIPRYMCALASMTVTAVSIDILALAQLIVAALEELLKFGPFRVLH